jgi:hypothetical protein
MEQLQALVQHALRVEGGDLFVGVGEEPSDRVGGLAGRSDAQVSSQPGSAVDDVWRGNVF